MNQWFALTAKPRHEKTIDHILRNKGLESFLPLYRARQQWSDRTKLVDLPLFPGYVFCRFGVATRLPVLTTPGVTSIVGFANTPAPVADEEIAGIQAILASRLPSRPWPYLATGQSVRIEHGSLAGLEGVLLHEKNSLRVVLSVELLRRSVAVEIDRGMIRALQGAADASKSYLYLTN